MTLVPFDLDVSAGGMAEIVTHVQLSLKPMRLVIDPEVAKDFSINDIRVGKNSQFAAHGSVAGTLFPASPPDKNPINNLAGIDRVPMGSKISLVVTNRNMAARSFSAIIYAMVDYD